MKSRSMGVLKGLAALLALYLCAPFLSVLGQLRGTDWRILDIYTVFSAIGISAASSTVACVFIALGGIPLGYYLARHNTRVMAWLGFVVQLPLALPPLTSGVLLLFMFGPYGLVGHVLDAQLTDSFTGIVLAEIFVAAPFLIIAARSAFAEVDRSHEKVAATLGLGPWQRFFRIVLPLAWPSIRAGLLLSWLRAFGEFGATVMVAYHPYSLPVYTYVAFGSMGLPAMLPLLAPTLAVALLISLLASWRGSLRLSILAALPARMKAPLAALKGKHDLMLALSARRGEFDLHLRWRTQSHRLAILGASGSGKSLSLRLISGTESAPHATVVLGGEDLSGVPMEQRGIAWVPQDYGLFPHLDVAAQLALSPFADPAVAAYWLAHLGLCGLENRLPAQLSLGQRQRVALARALSCRARLLLLDEPFSALDTPRRRDLVQALRKLQGEIDCVTLLVTHDPDEAALLADEIMVLDEGRCLQSGPVQSLFRYPASLKVAKLLGLDNVGEGSVDGAGVLHTNAGLVMRGSFAANARVMWRLPLDAIQLAAESARQAEFLGFMPRRGEMLASFSLEGEVLLARIEPDADLQPGRCYGLTLKAGECEVWPIVGATDSQVAESLSVTDEDVQAYA
jgi:molybdate transport system permease protein